MVPIAYLKNQNTLAYFDFTSWNFRSWASPTKADGSRRTNDNNNIDNNYNDDDNDKKGRRHDVPKRRQPVGQKRRHIDGKRRRSVERRVAVVGDVEQGESGGQKKFWKNFPKTKISPVWWRHELGGQAGRRDQEAEVRIQLLSGHPVPDISRQVTEFSKLFFLVEYEEVCPYQFFNQV